MSTETQQNAISFQKDGDLDIPRFLFVGSNDGKTVCGPCIYDISYKFFKDEEILFEIVGVGICGYKCRFKVNAMQRLDGSNSPDGKNSFPFWWSLKGTIVIKLDWELEYPVNNLVYYPGASKERWGILTLNHIKECRASAISSIAGSNEFVGLKNELSRMGVGIIDLNSHICMSKFLLYPEKGLNESGLSESNIIALEKYGKLREIRFNICVIDLYIWRLTQWDWTGEWTGSTLKHERLPNMQQDIIEKIRDCGSGLSINQ